MLFEEITVYDCSYQLGQVTSLDLHMIDVNYKDETYEIFCTILHTTVPTIVLFFVHKLQ